MLFEIIHKGLYCTIHSLLKMWWTHVHLWGHWYPYFGLLVMSPLGFKARVGSLICTWLRCTWCMCPQIHLWCDTYWPLGGQHTYLWTSMGWDLRPRSIALLPHSVRPDRPSTNWAMLAQYTLLSRSLQTIFDSSIFQRRLELNHVDAFGDQLKPGPIYAVTFIPGAPLTVY